VEAVGEDSATAVEDAVDGFRKSYREAADPIRQGPSMPGLREEMHVVALDGEFDEAKLAARRCRNGPADRGKDAAGAERAEGWVSA
jgi:hypothetical protein